ncbi:MAG: bifunctional (p)ppGpp synthetase/guanosine-3',5'-bis(diphosphate) 3'-pyrophosphohydrolase [Nitrospirota bacterium]|nr:bifunctional (p)ppGpp synthetase/guanosine-3',5'-bis(diphosphate) 3'-pyrophosphohydrolase [Nitrospirota bacterium]
MNAFSLLANTDRPESVPDPNEHNHFAPDQDVTIDSLLEQVGRYNPSPESLELIRKAYLMALKSHEGQHRQSGDSYIHHPLNVAMILAEMRVDPQSLITALLHDTLEDTSLSPETIEATFGKKVLQLIDGVTKIGKYQFKKSQAEKQAENFRKMLLSMSEDIRVLLVKLADRLHNMRTIKWLDPAKQKGIAQETLDIYAPLANRLGIGWIKLELEDLSFSVLDPETYADLKLRVARKRKERMNYIDQIVRSVSDTLKENAVPGRVVGRYKHIYSIYRKMTSQEIPFDEIYDLMGIRIITDTKLHCYAVLGLLHGIFKPMTGRIKDFIAVPKSNMYQSLHTTVIGPEGVLIEFQIRTEEMHRVAEEGVAAHWNYKENMEGAPSLEDLKVVTWLRQLVEWQKELSDNQEFMNSVKLNLFPDEVYVFTPKGDVREMIKGSTAIDFAYGIHTEVGNRTVGARINGRWVPIKTVLESGDVVEIVTNAAQTPSKDWLRFVATPKARARIRHWIKEEETRQSTDMGLRSLEAEAHKMHRRWAEFLKEPFLETLLSFSDLPEPTVEDVYSRVGFGRIPASAVLKKLLPDQAGESPVVTGAPHVQEHVPIVVRGGGKDLLLGLAGCCSPVPGEEIVGYVTRGRGIIVHTSDCPNLVHLSIEQDRIVPAVWDSSRDTTFDVKLRVSMEDKPGMLAAVSSAISERGANITHAEVKQAKHRMGVLDFTITISNLSHLQEIMSRIQHVKGVVRVQRIKTSSDGSGPYNGE